ncbi:hypothetical protein [Pseudomonas sp. EpS/L25]|uniref:hypothetical protein n=1 Tax=Pseudomonas sp. EpS/L25 TaxID=1749078 RepID=UPI000743359E|nr:hypothetical protein [Pseudomonas sp. EpS/L25]KUM43673.1 hypothetical protein AR540_17965 [Pseudomonas sp. EpS/L25]
MSPAPLALVLVRIPLLRCLALLLTFSGIAAAGLRLGVTVAKALAGLIRALQIQGRSVDPAATPDHFPPFQRL